MLKTVEDAYQLIAQTLSRAANEGWSELTAKCPIWNKALGGVVTTQKLESGVVVDLPLEMDIFSLHDACLFLRDELLATRGDRIWGLTFKLYPDGKFNIEYDYNKPENFEESDQTTEVQVGAFPGNLRSGKPDK
jgi:hypothetical protein